MKIRIVFLRNIGLKLGHAPASLALQRILSEKLQYLCFSQVPAGSDCSLSYLYCICRFSLLVYTVLLFAELANSDRLKAALFHAYTAYRFHLLFSQSFSSLRKNIKKAQLNSKNRSGTDILSALLR